MHVSGGLENVGLINSCISVKSLVLLNLRQAIALLLVFIGKDMKMATIE